MDAWAMLELALRALPQVAASVQDALDAGRYDDATEARVRKILSTTSSSEATRLELEKLRDE